LTFPPYERNRGEGKKKDSGQSHEPDEVNSSHGQDDQKEKGDSGRGDADTDDSTKPDNKKESSDEKDQKPKKPPVYKKPVFIITAAIVLVVLIVVAIVVWLIVRQYVSTDDAYIDGNITQISPQISAQTVALHIDDNQFVHKGDLLIELDPTDYQVALDQTAAQVVAAQGQLAQAEAQIDTAKASVTEAIAAVDAAQVQFDNFSRDLKRYQEVDERARSKQQLDNAATTQKNGQAQLAQAKARKVSADAEVISAEASVKAANGQLKTALASQKRAEVNLSYCKIFAPVDGRVTQRTVDVGNYVVPGQALFMLVDPNVWVTANFKETQLTLMRPGQPVTLSVDAFPQLKFNGHVESIQAGSGSRFGVLPAENATGNYVKIVQRVPVKIVFEHDANTNNAPMLSPGLSVEPRVKVR
jgi:membrane fusion protein (multidrug efflux system)